LFIPVYVQVSSQPLPSVEHATSISKPLLDLKNGPVVDSVLFLKCRSTSTHAALRHLSAISSSYLVTMRRLAVVTDELHATKHSADSEEAKDFSANDANLGKLLSVDVTD
jgi:hypothetical protein